MGLGTRTCTDGRRHHRGARLVVAASVLAATVLADAGMAGADPLCQTAAGRVADQYGVGVAYATVTVDTTPCGAAATTVTADAQGRYSVLLYPTVKPIATARRAGYVTASHVVAVVQGNGVSNDFVLRYEVTTSSTPSWVRPGDPVTITATSLATPPSASSGYVCEWGYSFSTGTEPHDPAPVAGLGGTGVLSGATAVAAGNSFNAALLADGTVATWGTNTSGSLGDGTRTDSYGRAAGRVADTTGTATLTGVTQIAAGSFHTLARRNDGTVVTWGANWLGQLGVAGVDESAVPRVVPSPDGSGPLTGVVMVSAGGEQSVALLGDGRLARWGYVTDGLSGGVTSPEWVRDATGTVVADVVSVDAGDQHVAALRADGTVLSWGSNLAGQLGNGSLTGSTTPVNVVGYAGTGTLGSVASVSAGSAHTLVVLDDGTAAAWGSAQSGELGDGTASPAPGTVPRRVVAESGSGTISGVASITAAGSHSLAVLRTGQVMAWGENTQGQLGTGTTTNSAVPVRAVGGDGTGVLAGITSLSGDWPNTVGVRSGPCDQARAPSRLWAEYGTSRVEMSPGITDSQGTHWATTLTASGSDGTKTVRVCALDAGFTGSCWAGELVGPLVSLNPARTASFGVDSTPPAVTLKTPTAAANVADRRPRLAAALTDTGSGVRASTVTLKLDGTLRPAVLSAGTVAWTPTADLALGLHTVEVAATDMVGNTMAAVVWQFNVVTVTAAATTMRVDPVTKTVMQLGDMPPVAVTFPAATATMAAHDLTVSSVIGDGVGDYARIPELGSHVTVTFSNGVTSETVTASSVGTNPASVWVFGKLAALAPSADPLVATVKATAVPLGNFTVTVPPAYRVPGATATLGSDDVPIPAATSDHRSNQEWFPIEILDQPLRGAYVLSVNATSSVAYDDSDTSVGLAAGASPSGNPQVGVTLQLPSGATAAALRAPIYLGDLLPGTKLDEGPDVKCWGGAGYTTYRYTALTIPCLWSGTWLSQQNAWVSFPNTPIGLYGNHWIARSATSREFLDWHQVAVSVRDYACPRGNTAGTVGVALDSFRTESAQVALAPNGQSLWDVLHFDRPQSLLGGDDLSWEASPPNWLRLYTEQGFGPDDVDALYDTSDFNDLTRSSGPVYTAVRWHHPTGDVTSNRDVHMGMATRYRPNNAYASTASRLFSTADTELYSLSLTYGC